MKECNEKAACIGRREFLVKAALIGGGTLLTVSSLGRGAFGAVVEDVTIKVDDKSPLVAAGGSEVVDSSAGKIIVINAGDGKYLAFAAACTHKGTTVNYDSKTKQLVCPNHGSKFSGTDGSVVNGPADDPLSSYTTKTSGTSVVVSVK